VSRRPVSRTALLPLAARRLFGGPRKPPDAPTPVRRRTATPPHFYAYDT